MTQNAQGGDAFDALLNAFTLARNFLEKEKDAWTRFPEQPEPWHWFPVIPPSLGKRFDSIVRKAVDAEHRKFCRGD